MEKVLRNFSKETVLNIKNGGIGVVPTDTIYGIVGSALNKKAVQKIYDLKSRNERKPFIILISSIKDLEIFGVKLSFFSEKVLKDNWPGPVSIILDVPAKKFEYLHRGTKSLAFRLPRVKTLREFIKKTGPLVAPSANPEGKEPAKNIKEAREYFGNSVGFYIDKGNKNRKPSRLIRVKDSNIEVLRK